MRNTETFSRRGFRTVATCFAAIAAYIFYVAYLDGLITFLSLVWNGAGA